MRTLVVLRGMLRDGDYFQLTRSEESKPLRLTLLMKLIDCADRALWALLEEENLDVAALLQNLLDIKAATEQPSGQQPHADDDPESNRDDFFDDDPRRR
jgi:hypothetical protein